MLMTSPNNVIPRRTNSALSINNYQFLLEEVNPSSPHQRQLLSPQATNRRTSAQFECIPKKLVARAKSSSSLDNNANNNNNNSSNTNNNNNNNNNTSNSEKPNRRSDGNESSGSNSLDKSTKREIIDLSVLPAIHVNEGIAGKKKKRPSPLEVGHNHHDFHIPLKAIDTHHEQQEGSTAKSADSVSFFVVEKKALTMQVTRAKTPTSLSRLEQRKSFPSARSTTPTHRVHSAKSGRKDNVTVNDVLIPTLDLSAGKLKRKK